MNKKQGAKLNMYGSTLNHNRKNKNVTEPMPALQNAYGALGAVEAAISSSVTQQEASKKGHTTNKGNNKNNLSEFGNQVAGAIFAWAVLNNMPVIMEQVRTTASELSKQRDEKLGKSCMLYYQIAMENASALTDFGLTKEVLTAFKQAIDSYEAVVPEPRNAVAEKKRYMDNLKELFKKGDYILKYQIDKLVLPLKKSNPDYYKEYKTNRSIVNAATNATALRITVKDTATGQAINGAAIMVEALKWEAITDKEGQATAKPVPFGTYTAIVKKEGYQTQTIDALKATLGKTNNVEVLLKKVG